MPKEAFEEPFVHVQPWTQDQRRIGCHCVLERVIEHLRGLYASHRWSMLRQLSAIAVIDSKNLLWFFSDREEMGTLVSQSMMFTIFTSQSDLPTPFKVGLCASASTCPTLGPRRWLEAEARRLLGALLLLGGMLLSGRSASDST
jgi:hypothetical protein